MVPYRTIDNLIDGVVLSFFDITTLRAAENAARAADVALEALAELSSDPVLVVEGDDRVVLVNTAFTRAFARPPSLGAITVRELVDALPDVGDVEAVVRESRAGEASEVVHEVTTAGGRRGRVVGTRIGPGGRLILAWRFEPGEAS